MVESVLEFSYNEVGFLKTQKFTHDIPENIPQTGDHNPDRYIGGIREFRPGSSTYGRWGGNFDARGI